MLLLWMICLYKNYLLLSGENWCHAICNLSSPSKWTSSRELRTVTVELLLFTSFRTTFSLSPMYPPPLASKWQALVWFVLSTFLYCTCCVSGSLLWITFSNCKQFVVKGVAPTKVQAAQFFSSEKAIAYASKYLLNLMTRSTPPKTNNPTISGLNDTILPLVNLSSTNMFKLAWNLLLNSPNNWYLALQGKDTNPKPSTWQATWYSFYQAHYQYQV